MNIFLTIVYIIFGIGFLYKGSEWLVGSTERLARSWRISKAIIALTIIAIGTSLPELAASLVAALQGASGVALGNVIGSNIANIGLVLGLAVVIRPFGVKLTELLKDAPWLILGSVLMLIMAVDGVLTRIEGSVLVAFALLFYYSVIKHVRGSRLQEKDLPWQKRPKIKVRDYTRNIGILVVGLVAVVGGAKLLVTGALDVARLLSLPEVLVGLTVVALGTSLPEIAVSSWSARKGQSEIALGNVIGSNISNIFLILGLVALATPISVGAHELRFDLPVMILLTFLALWFARTKEFLHRREGVILIFAYLIYIVWTFIIR